RGRLLLQAVLTSLSGFLFKPGLTAWRTGRPVCRHREYRAMSLPTYSVRCKIWDKARPEVWVEIEIGVAPGDDKDRSGLITGGGGEARPDDAPGARSLLCTLHVILATFRRQSSAGIRAPDRTLPAIGPAGRPPAAG